MFPKIRGIKLRKILSFMSLIQTKQNKNFAKYGVVLRNFTKNALFDTYSTKIRDNHCSNNSIRYKFSYISAYNS